MPAHNFAAQHDHAELADGARKALDEEFASLALGSPHLSQGMRDAAADFKAAIGDVLDAASSLDTDIADLRGKADLYPVHGFQRLQRERVDIAQQTLNGADHRADVALRALHEAATEASMPQIPAGRESLAREEFAAAIGEATGSKAAIRLLDIVSRGSREAAAVAFSSFGQTVLEARGLSGRDFTEAMESARAVAANAALEAPQDAAQLVAAKIRQDTGRLGAVKGFAGTALLQSIHDAAK